MRCPSCRSNKMVKSGKVWTGRKNAQRYLCKNCGRTTVQPKD